MSRLSLVAVLALVASGCSTPASILASGAAPSSLTIDGASGDWAGALQPVAKEPGLSLGVRNDGDAMYVVLTANTPEQAGRLARGVTFWFDGAGGTKRAFGVGFPSRPERGAGGEGRGPGARGDDGGRDAQQQRRFAESTRRMTVYRAGGGELQVGTGDVPGVQPAARWTDSGLVLELRVPSGADASGYAVNASGETVGFGIELVDVRERPQGAGRQGAGAGGGRQGGGGGGGRAGGGRAGGGGRGGADAGERTVETSTMWYAVTLSK